MMKNNLHPVEFMLLYRRVAVHTLKVFSALLKTNT